MKEGLKQILNIPNTLTMLRIFAILPFLFFLFWNSWQAKLVALIIFIVASFTDLVDGWLARKLKQQTKFGNFMDPLADKLFVAAALIALPSLERDIFPFWMVFFILSREFIVTYLRVFAISKSREIATMKLGKTKTTLQLVSIIVIISLIIFKKFLVQTGQIPESPGPIGIPIQDIVIKYFSNISIFITYTPTFLMFITMVITVFSGLQYIYKNRELFYTHEHKKSRNDVEN